MRTYIEPDCYVIDLDITNAICGSSIILFDEIDQTEILSFDDIENLF